MKLSKHEQKSLTKSATKKTRRDGIKAKIEQYPGRVVTVDQAYDRIKKGRKDIHGACTTPIQKNYQRDMKK